LRDVPDAAVDQRVRRQASGVLAIEQDAAALTAHEAADGPHQRRLAGAVESDQPDDAAAQHVEAHVLDDVDPRVIAAGHALYAQQRPLGVHAPCPPRYASTTARSAITSSVAPSAMTAPAFMQTVRGQRRMIAGMSWLTTMKAWPAA